MRRGTTPGWYSIPGLDETPEDGTKGTLPFSELGIGQGVRAASGRVAGSLP